VVQCCPQYGVQRTSQNMPFLRAYTQGMAMFPSSNHALAAEFAQMAQMALATVRDPDAKALQDDMVLTDLTVPEHVQNSDVTAEMVCDLESTLIARTLAHILEPSDRGKTTLKVLMGEGLTLDEATVLINLAKRRLAEARASTSVEEDRALLVQRYEDLASRSAASMSLLDELRALKELARVLGVTQVQRAGDEVDFSRVIEAADKDEEADILRLGDGSEDEDGDDDDWDDD
jgi:hypothetical protein